MRDRTTWVLNAAKLRIRDLAKRAAWHWVLDVELPRVYSGAVKANSVNQNLALFVSQKFLEIPDSFRETIELLQNQYSMECRFVSLANQNRQAREHNELLVSFIRELSSARCVFLDDASPIVSCVALRPETTVVNLWHACGAFKRWGYSCAGKGFGRSERQLHRRPCYENLSLVTTSAPEVNWAYEEAMGLKGAKGPSGDSVVRAIGVSRTDRFFSPSFHERSFSDLYSKVPAAFGCRVLLYAPTFRGHVADAQSPEFLDLEELIGELDDDWVVLVKHHPYVKRPPAIPVAVSERVFDVSDEISIDELLVVSDCLVTDYSSVIFEWSLAPRPVCFLVPDLGEYDDSRGFYYSLEELCPGPIFFTTREVAAFANATAGEFDASEVAAFRNRFMGACDGFSTERMARAVLPERLGVPVDI